MGDLSRSVAERGLRGFLGVVVLTVHRDDERQEFEVLGKCPEAADREEQLWAACQRRGPGLDGHAAGELQEQRRLLQCRVSQGRIRAAHAAADYVVAQGWE